MNRSSSPPPAPWYRRIASHPTLQPALASSVCCALAFPPLGWSYLIWLAPLGWLYLINKEQLPGQRPYRTLWVAGFVFWALILHWLRLPHPVNYLLWTALASYLGCYLPAFVALSRVGVHRLRLPLWLVAPVVWTGLDLVRAHLATGFLMGSLAHTQVNQLPVIQVAALLGEYGVTFLIMLIAACLAQVLFSKPMSPSRRLLPLLPALAALALAITFGRSQSADLALSEKGQPALRVALIQGNALADWKGDVNKQQRIMEEQYSLSFDAVRASMQQSGAGPDLIIWAETMFRYPLATAADDYVPPEQYVHETYFTATRAELQEFVRQTGAAVLTGIDRVHITPGDTDRPDFKKYNSSVLVDKQGEIQGTYDKTHLVILGEYMPFTRWLPFLTRLNALTGQVEAGEQPAALRQDNFLFCPNICYETCVPHLIRHQVRTATETAGNVPDALVNLTNDAWFWGSSELEMHLACGIFRAVEMRVPLLIAANGGLSAHIDAYGSVRQVTPRQETATLLVNLPRRTAVGLTPYARWGDWFAGCCLVCCVVLAITGYRNHKTAP